jgi:hypothetical protein
LDLGLSGGTKGESGAAGLTAGLESGSGTRMYGDVQE